MSTTPALAAVILNDKNNKKIYKTISVSPESMNEDGIMWLSNNIDILKEIINKYLTKDIINSYTPKFGIKLKRECNDNEDTTQVDSIVVTEINKDNINCVATFFQKSLSERMMYKGTKYYGDIDYIRLITSRKLGIPLQYNLERLYEFNIVDEVFENGIPDGHHCIPFEQYVSSIRHDLMAMLKYQATLNLWEKLKYRDGIRAITYFRKIYENHIPLNHTGGGTDWQN